MATRLRVGHSRPWAGGRESLRLVALWSLTVAEEVSVISRYFFGRFQALLTGNSWKDPSMTAWRRVHTCSHPKVPLKAPFRPSVAASDGGAFRSAFSMGIACMSFVLNVPEPPTLPHRVQVPPEDGLGGESTSREWSWGVKGSSDSDGPGPLAFTMNQQMGMGQNQLPEVDLAGSLTARSPAFDPQPVPSDVGDFGRVRGQGPVAADSVGLGS